MAVGHTTSKFDLSLSLHETGDGLQGVLAYATDLFEAETAARLVGHYGTLLEGVVAAPDARVSRLQILTAAEREQLLVTWNDTAADYPRDRCIHQLFEAQAARTPESVALVFEDQSLTYAELNARANQLAHYLITLGVGPEVLVGICMQRSLELVVGLLGILKAGGAYVPLDPNYPAARLAFVLEDTQAPVLLTQQRLLARLPGYAGKTLCLDRDWQDVGVHSDANPASGLSSDALAYVIYTSGSTGQPKGVLGLQRGVINRLSWMWKTFAYEPSDVCCLKTSLSFVDSVAEIFGPLLQGVSLVVVSDEGANDLRRLVEVLSTRQVTRIVVVPSLLRALHDSYEDLGERLPRLKLWVTSGETLSQEHLDRFRMQSPHCRLINLYGSSEVAADVMYWEATATTTLSVVPIGRPLANTRIYILDQHGEVVPIGVPGELHVAGDGLARGYLNRPELTADKFVPDPFSAVAGARLYRTGDLARYLSEGNIEYLGRIDHQVKIRGFRIEPGEIEATLRGVPGVRQTVVAMREDRSGDRRLVAYVVVDRSALDPSSLRAELARRLPAYMVPSAINVLTALPLTPNGKIDRAALTACSDTPMTTSVREARPYDVTERHLIGIWESLFERTGVGLDEDFFAMGGHSLLAVRLVDAIARTFGVRLPLDTLWFQGSTVRALAELLRARDNPQPWPLLVPIKTGGDKPPLFCVHTIGGNLFHYFDLARSLAPDQPVLGLQARGVDGLAAPHSSIAAIAADCIGAMREAQPCGLYRIAGFSSGGLVAFEIAQQLQATGEAVALLVLIDTYTPGLHRRRHDDNVLKRAMRRVRPYLNRTRLVHAAYQFCGVQPPRHFPNAAAAHWWAHWNYAPKPYSGSVDLYLTEQSRDVARDASLGWASLIGDGLTVHPMPGSHGLIVKPPLVSRLAEVLQARLDAIVTEGD